MNSFLFFLFKDSMYLRTFFSSVNKCRSPIEWFSSGWAAPFQILSREHEKGVADSFADQRAQTNTLKWVCYSMGPENINSNLSPKFSAFLPKTEPVLTDDGVISQQGDISVVPPLRFSSAEDMNPLFSQNWCLAVWSMSCYSLTHFFTYQLPLLITDSAAMWAILRSLICGPVADAACLMRVWPWKTEVSLLPVRIRILVCSCYGRTANAGQFYIKFSRKNRIKLLQICRTVLHR